MAAPQKPQNIKIVHDYSTKRSKRENNSKSVKNMGDIEGSQLILSEGGLQCRTFKTCALD